MAAKVLPLMLQRLGSSPDPRVRIASTPRLPGTGIDALYHEGSQSQYGYAYPACGRLQVLAWPQSVSREAAALICRGCGALMDLFAEGAWRAGSPAADIHSYHLPRWYSPAANIRQILREADAESFGDEESFANNIAAEVYAPDSSQVTLADLDGACRAYSLDRTDYRGQPCELGIDVGKRLHVVIREARSVSGPFARRLRFVGEVTFAELDALIERFHVQAGLIDSQPETYAASEFANRHPTVMGLADYTRRHGGHEAFPARGAEPPRLKINRTAALDQLLDEIRSGACTLPADARRLGGGTRGHYGAYYAQILASSRVIVRDGDDNWVARWVNRGPDHFAHGEVYCMLADTLDLGGMLLPPIQI